MSGFGVFLGVFWYAVFMSDFEDNLGEVSGADLAFNNGVSQLRSVVLPIISVCSEIEEKTLRLTELVKQAKSMGISEKQLQTFGVVFPRNFTTRKARKK